MNLATEVGPWQGSPEILNETGTPAITDAQIGHAADILIKTTDASGQWGLRRPPPNQRQQTSGPSSSTDASAAAATICARSSRRRKGSRLRRSRGRSLRRALCDRQCEFVGRFVLWRRYRSLCVQEGWATGVGIVSAAATSASDRPRLTSEQIVDGQTRAGRLHSAVEAPRCQKSPAPATLTPPTASMDALTHANPPSAGLWGSWAPANHEDRKSLRRTNTDLEQDHRAADPACPLCCSPVDPIWADRCSSV